MNDDANDMIESAAKGAVEGAAKAFAEKIPPLYTDLLQPGAKVLGKGIAGALTLALSPITATVWGYDRITEWFTPAMEERLQYVLPADIVTPKASVVGPAIEAIKFLGDENELRDMFANLIANSMKKDTKDIVHPGFVEILKNLASDDAIVLKYFAEHKFSAYFDLYLSEGANTFPKILSGESYLSLLFKVLPNQVEGNGLHNIQNLKRLGLIESPQNIKANSPGSYSDILNDPEIITDLGRIKEMGNTYRIEERVYLLTNLGDRFCEVCVK